MTSYSDFIAHHMSAENDHVTDDEHKLNRMKIDFGLFFSLFYSCKNFHNKDLNFTLFLRRNCGPSWLERLLFPNDTEESELANRSWASLLAVQVIPTGLPQHKKERFKATLYAPHYTARQLGFSLAIPTLLPKNSKPFCHVTLTSKKELDVCLLKNQQQREGYNHLVYDRSSFITKSCFDWWATYYSKYSRTLEEIKSSVIRAVPTVEGSPKRPLKRKAEATASSRQPPKKGRRTPSNTSRRLHLQPSSESASDDSEPSIQNILAASSKSDDAIDLDSGSQLIRRQRPVPSKPRLMYVVFQPVTAAQSITSSLAPDQPFQQHQQDLGQQASHSSIQAIASAEPLQDAELPTPPDLGSGDLGIVSESTDADLITLVTILNQVVQEDKVPISTTALTGPSTSNFPPEPSIDAREQLLALLKLLDHPPTEWTNNAALNSILFDVLSSSLELQVPSQHSSIINQFIKVANSYTTALQPTKASREEFDLRISQAFSAQAYYDKEERELEMELARINEKLAKI
ncbi:hypothetical protein Ahy_B05g074911 [Arachis hypogaea]|uniref:Aminotransferase-like plant mobile domain-containing protein n=1 Tax=Arachis hypogaea TaxID=3818 RepID=A0A444Z056_ARAHY|nr:hypothetical protein Ahy_B05g074911 [Arachis hypogaea]